MAKSLNRAILLGNVGSDPETRSTPGGALVTNISVATNERWKDKTTGEYQERVTWHRCTAWGKLAEIIDQYCRKGDRVYVEGRTDHSQYQDREGITRYSTSVVLDQYIGLSSIVGGSVASSDGEPTDERDEGPADNSGGPDDSPTGDAESGRSRAPRRNASAATSAGSAGKRASKPASKPASRPAKR